MKPTTASNKFSRYPTDVVGLRPHSLRFLFTTFALVIVLAAPTSLTSANSASPYPDLENIRGMAIVDGADGAGSPMTLIKAQTDPGLNTSIPCEGISDPDCRDKVPSAASYLLPCTAENSIGCIVEVYARSKTGEKVSAKFVRAVGASSSYDFNQSLLNRLPAGSGVGGLWQFPGVLHAGNSDIYSVSSRISGWAYPSTLPNSSFTFDSAQFQISAVTSSSGPWQEVSVNPNDAGSFGGYSSEYCVMTERNNCFQRARMPKDYRFGIRVRIPNALSGWFHGRVTNPEFEVSKSDSSFPGSIEYQVEALPVSVPVINKLVPYASWPSEFREFVTGQWPMSNGGAVLLPGNFGQLSIELTKRYLPMIEDKSSATQDFWIIKTLNSWGNGKYNEVVDQKMLDCSADTLKVSGLVTTNALVYSQGPPYFNKATESLDYTVLSPHFDETGSENVGTYDLLIDSQVARCVYGFSAAPIKAEIAIIGENGVAKVATTVLGERGPWLYLSANGFTFSQPIVRVKLSQAAPAPTPSPSASASPTPETSATAVLTPTTTPKVVTAEAKTKKTITCIKGTTKRKVVGISPKCPKGFKRT